MKALEGPTQRNSKRWGVTTLEDLLKKCCEKKGRKEIADKSGIGEKLVLSWVNRADLSRIKGVSTQYADLPECAGVDTVPELAQRKPENLQSKMCEINAEKNLCVKYRQSHKCRIGWHRLRSCLVQLLTRRTIAIDSFDKRNQACYFGQSASG